MEFGELPRRHGRNPAFIGELFAWIPQASFASRAFHGRPVALEVYRLKPQRVARIALLNAPTGTPSNEETEWLNALLKLPFPAALPIPWQPHVERMRGMAQKWLQPTIHPDRFADTAFLYPASDKIARCSRQMVLAQYEAMLLRGDRSSVLERIRCPVLLLTGREDTRCPPLRYAEMAAKIRGCSLIVVPTAVTCRLWNAPRQLQKRSATGC